MIVEAVAALTAFAGSPAAPPVALDSYRVQADTVGAPLLTTTVQSPGRARIRSADGFLEVHRAGDVFIPPPPNGRGTILRKVFQATPDGFAETGTTGDDDLVAFVLAQMRGGALVATTTTLDGRPAWRADVPLPANDCAGLVARTAQIWIAQRTHMPLRVAEVAQSGGAVIRDTTYRYAYLNTRFSTLTFATPRMGTSAQTINFGFTRATPLAAAGPLPYVPRVPTVLPPGFRVAASGWARLSGITGPEGSIPASPWLYGVSFRRGQERIDITQRAATTDWPDSPFGAECQPLRTEPVTINGVAATFGIGESTVPHLYWREGKLRFTVSGPFPKDDLITIAASLRKAGT